MPETPTAMDHVRELSVGIGPRPSTREGERKAADYVAGVFDALAGDSKTETFECLRSGWRPFSVASFMALLAIVLFILALNSAHTWAYWVAFAINSIAMVSSVMQLLFRPNPLTQFVSKGESRNVWSRLPSTDEPRQRLLITSHIDTHRTPLAYSSSAWVRLFRKLTTIGMGSYVILGLLILIAIIDAEVSAHLTFYHVGALLMFGIHLGIFLITFQADLTPHTPGANDNASGVGVMLEVAERLAADPLARTEVIVIATGAEEVGLYGASAFMKTHPDLIKGAMQLNIDNVGGEGCGPCYITAESMLATYRSDPALLQIADEVRADRPELGAYVMPYQGAYTDGAIGVMNGLPVITFLGLGPDGWIPNVHQMSDVIENVDARTVQKTTDFVEALVRAIDKHQPHAMA